MADAENPQIDEQAAAAAEATTERMRDLGDMVERANRKTQDLNKQFSELSRRAMENPGDPAVIKQLESISGSINRANRASSKMIDGKAFDTIGRLSSSLDGLEGKAASAAQNITKHFVTNNKKWADALKNLVPPGVSIFGQTAIVAGLKELDTRAGGVFTKMQQPLLDMEKRGMQMGIGLGKGFGESKDYMNRFREALTATQVDTNVFQKELTNVTTAFSSAFSPQEATGNLKTLSGSIKSVRGELNLTKVAVLTGAAVNMKSADVASMMTKAHLELGESVEGSATMLGNMAIASQKSGLSFSSVSKSLIDGAEKLKMWGATVGSVTPLYNKFADALGEGRKGLTGEIFQQYITGLQGMGFEMRSLIGITGGLGGGGGAIGAGLEMEALMETEGGMEEASKKLIETLKSFSGGELITRQQAIEDPSKNAQFMIQRQFLQKMVGGNDAMANKMLEGFKKLEEGGGAADAVKALSSTLGKGERIQDASVTALQREEIKGEAVQLNAGANVAGQLGPMIGKFQKQLGAAREFSTGVAKTGTFDMKGVSQLVKGFTGEKAAGQLMGMLDVKGTKGQEQVRSGAKAGSKDVMSVMDELNQALAQKRQATLTGGAGGIEGLNNKEMNRVRKGNMRVEDVAAEFNQSIAQLGDKIESIEGQAGSRGLSTEEHARIKVLEEAARSLAEARDRGQRITGVQKLDLPPVAKMDQLAAPGVPTQPRTTSRVPTTVEPKPAPFNMEPAALRRPELTEPPKGIPAVPEDKIMQIAAKEPLPVIPTRAAIEATEQVRREKIEFEVSTTKPIEQDIKLHIKSDKQTVTIEIDDQVIEEKINQTFNTNRSVG